MAPVAAEWASRREETQDTRVRGALAGRPEMAGELARVLRALDGAEELASALGRRVQGVLGGRGGVGLRPGDVLGGHEILGELGSGGMGRVYLARPARDLSDEKVAIKVMSSAAGDPAARGRFLLERQFLAALDHPAIVRLMGGGVTCAGRPYHVLEYVDGVTADRFAAAADLPGALASFRDLCDAVAHAHARGILHGDLKPANVLVTREGRVKLLDFGVARALAQARRRPRSGDPGPLTRNYAAPELLGGADVDLRADVYSLGVLLYRLTCLEQPYRLPPCGRAELRAAREAVVVPPLGRRGLLARERSPVIAALDAIVRRATEVEPDERTGSVRALAEEVGRVQDRLRLSARPRRRALRARAAIRRRPAAVALAVAASLLAAAAVAV